MEETRILDVKVHKVTMQEAKNTIIDLLGQGGLKMVHTPNPEFILLSLKDPLYKTILNEAALSVPDGIGVVIASKFTKTKLKTRVPGCELLEHVLDGMQDTDHQVFFLGGRQDVLEKALENIKAKYPRLKIAGFRNGYFKDSDDEAIIEQINGSGASLLVVGMGGIPKQETWVYQYRKRLAVRVTIGVGGTIDVLSGTVKRAPVIYRKLGLEWLYRTLSEPKKRLPRVYKLPYFLLLSFFDSFKTKNQKTV